jgi:N-acetylglutamate synthase-like GNAT family acetyltransferase/anti-sigma regulatory factor (Ser/Thr protein kinase)
VAAAERRRHDRITEVIESTVITGIYEVLDDYDFPPQRAQRRILVCKPSGVSTIDSVVSRVKVTFLSDASGPSLVLGLLPAFASAAGVRREDERRLGTVVEGLVRFTLDNAYPDDDLGELELTLEADADLVHVTVHDWGLPLSSAGGDFGPLPEPLAALAPDAQDVRLLNLGSDGKRLTAAVPVQSTSGGNAARHHLEAAPRLAQGGTQTPKAIDVRAATAQDAEAIAQLLYENYHLSYVHADFYRPRYLVSALQSGELVSTIAVHEGRVIAHHALMPISGVPSAETGAAVVHSAYRGVGIFGRLFESTLGAARDRGLASIFGDAVTIHPFSQRAERSHGYRETALQLGMFPAQTTMRGFGGDGPKRRTATLRSYRPFDDHARQAAMPARYRKLLESIYANVGLAAVTPPGPAPSEGDAVTAEVDEPRGLGFLRLRRWDEETAPGLKQAVHHVLSRHVDVVYADLDLVAVSQPDEAMTELNELGFFVAGLVLHGPDGHDHLRFQLLDSEDIELDEIVCDSSFAEALRRHVLDDKARVGG